MRTLATVVALATLLPAATASAKEGGFSSPQGRRIYGPHEQFGEVLDQTRRNFVIEVVFGYAPEGNIGANLGWLTPVDGLELYLGVGLQANPSDHFVGTVRYFGSFGDFRPYVGTGYILQNLTRLGTVNHNWFVELGHKWRFHTTYHFTVGLGLRYIFGITVANDSPLSSSVVDPDFLESELDEVGRIAPVISVRLSRAF
jgi:hypothetical protein